MATRTPPRFVPTLTEVVHPPQSGQGASPEPAQSAQAQSTQSAQSAQPTSSWDAAPSTPSAPSPLAAQAPSGPAPLSPQAQEQIALRVLQRLDLSLDRRVREAIATVVLEQTSALAPLLRERLETVVRELVAEAVAEEWQARQRAQATSV
jgi:hypothetical protein